MTTTSSAISAERDMDARINSMYWGDIIFAWGFVAGLWATYLFVFFKVTAVINNNEIWNVLAIGGGLVLLFNTVAIIALVNHYTHEKRFIYGLDIRHLDEMRAMRR